jgi:uncharacterized protein
MYEPKNVLGKKLESCCTNPMTGFYRDGRCRTGPDDRGRHVVCVKVTAEFLEFSRRAGNDLSTPHPEFRFPGLKPGDCWCLCAERWQEALKAGFAPPVKLAATDVAALEFITLDDLREHSIEDNEKEIDLSVWKF